MTMKGKPMRLGNSNSIIRMAKRVATSTKMEIPKFG